MKSAGWHGRCEISRSGGAEIIAVAVGLAGVTRTAERTRANFPDVRLDQASASIRTRRRDAAP
jgi:hypothetical protein